MSSKFLKAHMKALVLAQCPCTLKHTDGYQNTGKRVEFDWHVFEPEKFILHKTFIE